MNEKFINLYISKNHLFLTIINKNKQKNNLWQNWKISKGEEALYKQLIFKINKNNKENKKLKKLIKSQK